MKNPDLAAQGFIRDDTDRLKRALKRGPRLTRKGRAEYETADHQGQTTENTGGPKMIADAKKEKRRQ